VKGTAFLLVIPSEARDPSDFVLGMRRRNEVVERA
jgi:hypothetical protein